MERCALHFGQNVPVEKKTAAAEDLIGSTVDGRFMIESAVGVGATGLVYRARHTMMNKFVAIKVLRDECAAQPKLIERFRREAQTMISVEHPNIVKALACGVLTDGRMYVVMDYVEGLSLSETLARKKRLSQRTTVELAIAVANALDCAHQKGIVHRDITPSNIMLPSERPAGEAQVLDFGLAKITEDASEHGQTTTGVKGTAQYMSPEQCNQQPVDQRSDIYALGCVMFQCLAGNPPYEAESSFDLMYKHVHESVPALPKQLNIDKKLAGVVNRCLQKDPSSRYASAAVLKEELHRVLDCLPSEPEPQEAESAQTVGATTRAHIGIWAVLSVVLAVFAFGGLMFSQTEAAASFSGLLHGALSPSSDRWRVLSESASAAMRAGRYDAAQFLNEQANAQKGLKPDDSYALRRQHGEILNLRGKHDESQREYLGLWEEMSRSLRHSSNHIISAKDKLDHDRLAMSVFSRIDRSTPLPSQAAVNLHDLACALEGASPDRCYGPYVHSLRLLEASPKPNPQDQLEHLSFIRQKIAQAKLYRLKDAPSAAYKQQEVQEARSLLVQALNDRKLSGHYNEILTLQMNAWLAASAAYLGNPDEAMSYHSASLRFFKKLSDIDRRNLSQQIARCLQPISPTQARLWKDIERQTVKELDEQSH